MTASATTAPTTSADRTPFDAALLGDVRVLELACGERIELPVDRWQAAPDTFDDELLACCAGPALDIGCGSGRLTGALIGRGVPTLGVDVSGVAVELTRQRGAPALGTDVFGRIPGTGRWRHALLADGSIGIGGDPARLLCRVTELLAPGGTAMVELDRPGTGLRREAARLAEHDGWFPWATVDVDAIDALADAADMDVRAKTCAQHRWFAELVRRPTTPAARSATTLP